MINTKLSCILLLVLVIFALVATPISAKSDDSQGNGPGGVGAPEQSDDGNGPGYGNGDDSHDHYDPPGHGVDWLPCI